MIATRAKPKDNNPLSPAGCYYVFAITVCKDSSEIVCDSEPKGLIAALGIAWYPNDDLLEHDRMNWQRVLQTLERVGKVDYNSWGETRGKRSDKTWRLPYPCPLLEWVSWKARTTGIEISSAG